MGTCTTWCCQHPCIISIISTAEEDPQQIITALNAKRSRQLVSILSLIWHPADKFKLIPKCSEPDWMSSWHWLEWEGIQCYYWWGSLFPFYFTVNICQRSQWQLSDGWFPIFSPSLFGLPLGGTGNHHPMTHHVDQCVSLNNRCTWFCVRNVLKKSVMVTTKSS